MRFQVSPDTLASALKILAPAYGSKQPFPVLKMVYIEVLIFPGYEDVKLTATDNEITISVSLAGATANQIGKTLINPKILKAVLEQKAVANSASVTIEQSDSDSPPVLIAGRQVTPLDKDTPLDPLEYPSFITNTESAQRTTVEYSFPKTCDLLYGLKVVTPFISTDGGRPNLTGALLEPGDAPNTATFVSCDGHVYGQAFMPCMITIKTTGHNGVIIPKPFVDDVLPKIVHGESAVLRVHSNGSNLSYTCPAQSVNGVVTRGEIFASTRLIDASFPDFRRVIPASKPQKGVLVERKDLTDVAKEIAKVNSAFAKSAGQSKMMLRVEPIIADGQAEILLSGMGAQSKAVKGRSEMTGGAIVSAIPLVPNAPNHKTSIGINPDYLQKIAASNAESLMEVEMPDALSAMLWRAVTNTPDFTGQMITMPMRL